MNAHTPASSAVFREIASAIGRKEARRLVEALGGSRIYVPKAPGEGHKITEAIGLDAAKLLATYFHGTWLVLPVVSAPLRRQRVRELAQSGALTRAAIATETGISERQVYRIVGKSDRGQRDLFDEPD